MCPKRPVGVLGLVVAAAALVLADGVSAQLARATIIHSVPGQQQETLAPVATGDAQFGTVEAVSIEARTGWPHVLTKGYFPVAVELENGSDEERLIELELRRYGAGWRSQYITRRTASQALALRTANPAVRLEAVAVPAIRAECRGRLLLGALPAVLRHDRGAHRGAFPARGWGPG